jgi:hypothetical protein
MERTVEKRAEVIRVHALRGTGGEGYERLGLMVSVWRIWFLV